MTKVAKQGPASERLAKDAVRYRLFRIPLERPSHACGPDCLCWQEEEREANPDDHVSIAFNSLEN